jgi:hypothetical protein
MAVTSLTSSSGLPISVDSSELRPPGMSFQQTGPPVSRPTALSFPQRPDPAAVFTRVAGVVSHLTISIAPWPASAPWPRWSPAAGGVLCRAPSRMGRPRDGGLERPVQLPEHGPAVAPDDPAHLVGMRRCSDQARTSSSASRTRAGRLGWEKPIPVAGTRLRLISGGTCL